MILCAFGHETHLIVVSIVPEQWKVAKHTSDILSFKGRACTGCKPSAVANEATTLLLVITRIDAQVSSARLSGTRRLGLTRLMSNRRTRF